MPPASTVTRADAAHLLRRTGFGGTADEITTLTGRTRSECVDAVMGFRAGDPVPAGPDVPPPFTPVRDGQWRQHADLLDWWITRLVDMPNPTAVPSPVPPVASPTPLQEQMTLFWHDHFACAQDKVHDIGVMFDQVRLFRRAGLGSFRDLLRAVSVHPAMLVYLDNESNVAGAEQENFARELMELYTIGVGEFSEDDVIAMARAWTGHNTVGWNGSVDDHTYVYRPDRHDHGPKTLFGITADFNGIAMAPGERDVVDELCFGVKQIATARFLARKVFAWFAHPDPTEAVVSELAGVFVASGMSIAALVRAVLLHDAFWGPESRWNRVKSPVEFVVSLFRRLPVRPADAGLRWRMEPLGQILFDPPGVAGWPSGAGWLSTATAWGRGGFVQGLRWRASEAGFLAGIDTLDPAAGAGAVFDAFGIEEVSAATRSAVERWFADARAGARWSIPPQGFVVGALCPEFQLT